MGVLAPMPAPGNLPWISLVFVRVLPERARAVVPIDGGPSKADPAGFVLIYNVNERSNKLGIVEESCLPLADQTPLDSAVRGCYLQLGIAPAPERFYYLNRWVGGKSDLKWKYLFCADMYQSENDKINPKHKSPDGQMPFQTSRSDMSDVLRDGRLFEGHRYRLELAKLLPVNDFAVAV